MKPLSPEIAATVAAVAVPLLLLLYFLKLRRQERRISSTLLWKRAIMDLRVNAPFQKLRKNLLLFLQLLLLAAVIFGIANPVANFLGEPERNIVLLVDRSASMRSIEADGRMRLEHAQEAAVDFISNLPDNSRAMVIGFAGMPKVVCTFTTDKQRLQRLIRQIEPTDELSRIGEALPLAIAYSTNLVDVPGAAGSSLPDGATQGAADIELFSDGRISDAGDQFVTRGRMRYYRVGAAADNVGIVAFDVRRDWDRPGMLSVFVQIQNFGPETVTSDLTLSLDGKALPGPGAVREVSLGPAAPATGAGKAASAPAAEREDGRSGVSADAFPSSQNVLFSFQHEAGGVIQVELHRKDALAADNVVQAAVDPPRRVRVLGVTDRSPMRIYLSKAMTALDIGDFELMTTDEYEKAPDKELISEGRSAFEVVILDYHDTDRLPPGNYMFLGGLPKIEGVARQESVDGEPIIFAREDHPLMRNVNYEGIHVVKWPRLSLPDHALGLLEGSDSTVMAMVTDPGHRYVITAFDMLDSNMPLREAFPIFLQNAVGYLGTGGLVDVAHMIQPGQTLSIPAPAGAERVRIHRPDGRIEEQAVRSGSIFSYAGTHDQGVYRAEFDDSGKTVEIFAANLLDGVESHISPSEGFAVGSEAVEGVAGGAEVNKPLWPYAAALAMLLLFVEWWVYNRRIMI